MTFEISLPSATEDPAMYVAALLSVLGEREPLRVLEATPAAVRGIASGLTEERLNQAPGPVAGHQVHRRALDLDRPVRVVFNLAHQVGRS
jgi:hypothetical protein